jgi:ABC-type sugar transport system substrate-binding protein
MFAANLSGKRIGDFILEDRIGRGGMAVVYRALQVSVNRYVAVKLVPLDIEDELHDEFTARFDLEIRLIASLEHIHILPVYAYGIVDGEYSYLAMRLMRGGTLADLLRNGPLPLERAVAIFSQIGRALQHAHDRGVIHRDLKPSNILLDEAGNAYLSDFGLAKLMELSLDLTRSGNLVGTPAYVAPELIRGEPADPRSDIYSLGIILYHMLGGRPPFEQSESGVLALLYKQVEEEPPSLRHLNPDIPSPVETIVMQALRKRPEDRYASAEGMVLDLNAATGRRINNMSYPAIRMDVKTPVSTAVPAGLLRLRQWWWAATLVIMVLIGGGLLISTANHQPRVATILAGQYGTIDSVAPTDTEIGIAHDQLGQTGFIAYVACTLNDNTQARRGVEMEELANQYGFGYRVYDSDSDVYTQIAAVDRARLEGAKAFILCPLSEDALAETVGSLQAANIPIVFVTLVDDPYGIKLDSDNANVGQRMGEYAGQIIRDKWAGSANVLMLGFLGFSASDTRMTAVEAVVRQIAPQAAFLPRAQGYTRDESYEAVRQILQQGIEINVIISMNDAGTMGAVDALQEAGIDPNAVDIVSANAESPVLDLIREGLYIRGSLSIHREQLSLLAMYGIIKQLAGSTTPELYTYPPGEMVTAETLALEAPG